MGYCHEHKKKFGWTCPACEAAWEYMGRTQFLDSFNAGVRNNPEPQPNDPQHHAAYLHGQQYANKGVSHGNRAGNSRHSKGEQRDSVPLTQGVPMAPRKQAQPPAQEDTGLSFEAMVGAATVGSDAPKKSDKPIIKLSKTESVALVKMLNAKRDMKAAEGTMRAEEGPLLEICLNRQDTDGLAGHFAGSYTVITEDGKTKATFISQDKFSVNAETIDTLKVLLGDKYATEVKTTPVVTLKPEVFEDATLKAELVKLLGNNFGKFFQTKMTYSLKEGFDERLYAIAGNPANVIQLRTLCGKSKPYIK